MRRAIETWLARPRRSLVDAIPGSRFVQALWAFPYVCAGFLVAHLLGAEEDVGDDLWLLSVFTVIAVVETVFVVSWLRRPTRTQAARHERRGTGG